MVGKPGGSWSSGKMESTHTLGHMVAWSQHVLFHWVFYFFSFPPTSWLDSAYTAADSNIFLSLFHFKKQKCKCKLIFAYFILFKP